MKDVLSETLCEMGAEDRRVVVFDADLAGPSGTAVFGKKFPERFFDCGIMSSPGTVEYDPWPYEYSPDKAKECLAAAGYAPGELSLNIVIGAGDTLRGSAAEGVFFPARKYFRL